MKYKKERSSFCTTRANSCLYWTKSPGIGGNVAAAEDFVVEEIPLRKFFVKFARSGSGVKEASRHTLFLLKKKNMTTYQAIELTAKKFNLKPQDIGYAGLKDKFAVTSQYITVRGDFGGFAAGEMELVRIGMTDKMIQIGELEGNKFVIKLSGCRKPENAVQTINELKNRGMPNYFGSQRFGLYNNHEIGKLILKSLYGEALERINSIYREGYTSLKDAGKKRIKFFIHAYQSFIFNKVLGVYASKHSVPLFAEFPIVGCNTRIGKDFAGKETMKILSNDGIGIGNFSIRDLSISCSGSSRQAFVKPTAISCKVGKHKVMIEFTLPKGSYATVLIGELSKTTK